MFSIPRWPSRSSTPAISSRVASIAVTCAAPSMPRARIRATSSIVASRGFPPVRVTETNDGRSGRSASIVRISDASPSAVLGGKNSKEMTGPPRPTSSLIFTEGGPGPELLGALLLERLHLLLLPVVVARGHRHEQSFHTTVALAAQYSETLVEFAEVLVDAELVVHRVQEEVAEPGDGEAERGEAELIGERVPLGEGQRAERLVAGDEGLEALQVVLRAVEAERVHRGREVEDELTARRRLEVEDRDDLLALHDDVVVEEIAVDDALRKLRLEVVLEVIDLVVERA